MRHGLMPFRETNLSFRRPFEKLFRMMDESLAGMNRILIDVYEEGNDVVVKADLPGLSKNEVKVDVESDTLFLQARDQKDKEVNENKFYRRERSTAIFNEAVVLPAEVDKDNAFAKMENGVLEVRLPKVQSAKNVTRLEIN